MAAHEVRVIDAAAVIEGWPNATIDNWHFDGGLLRTFHTEHAASVREQIVSLNLLNLMLNALERFA